MANKLETEFGVIIREYRSKANISQDDLAEAANVHRTYISQIERGLKSPSLNVIFKLAHALKIPPHEIIKTVYERRHLRST